MVRRSKRTTGTFSPLLALVISVLDEEHTDRPGEARALRELGELALVQVPHRGVLSPNEDDLYKAIDIIARKHLRLAAPRKAFFELTASVEPFGKRDAIESAANHFRTVSDQAYFYAGLAFGVTFATLDRR